MRTATRNNITQLTRINGSWPGIASRRLSALSAASPIAASQLWSSWTFEKMMAFNSAAANMAIATAHMLWTPWWLRGSAAHRRDADVLGKTLAPIAKQVKRNARRKKANAY